MFKLIITKMLEKLSKIGKVTVGVCTPILVPSYVDQKLTIICCLKKAHRQRVPFCSVVRAILASGDLILLYPISVNRVSWV